MTDRERWDAVREFAERKIRHRSAEMDRTARLDVVLRGAVFAAGVMAVEIPRVCGGAGDFTAARGFEAVAGG